MICFFFGYFIILTYCLTSGLHENTSVLQEAGTEAAKKICDFRKCLCRAVSSQPLQTRSSLLHSILWHFLPLFLASLCAPFPNPEVSGSELTTVALAAVPWEWDVALHGCNQKSDHIVPRAEREAYALCWAICAEGEIRTAWAVIKLYYCL